MKILQSAVIALAISAASITTVFARDSFSIGINVGGYGHHDSYRESTRYYAAPPVVYYQSAAPVYYYGAPQAVYYSAPRAYHHAPIVSYGHQYYGRESRHHNGHRGHGGHRGHRGHGQHRGHH